MGWTQIGSQFVYISPTNGVILVYSGLPANGNLSISIAAASGVDQFGNSYPAGIGTFGGTSQFAPAITLSVNSPDLALASFINMFEAATGTGSEYFSAQWFGPEMTGHTDVVSVNLFSNFKNGSQSAQGELLYFSPGGTQYAPFIWNELGCNIIASLITGQHPGATVPTAETWQSLGSPSATGYNTLAQRYRMTPEGECEIDISLVAAAGGGTAGTYTYANTLGSSYQFSGSNTRAYPLGYNSGAALSPASLLVDPSGSGTPGRVRIILPALPATTSIGNTFCMPLT